MDSERYRGRGGLKRVAEELMGKVVEFEAILKRNKEWHIKDDFVHSTTVKWYAHELLEKKRGWVIGVRYLQNGEVKQGANDYPFNMERYNYLEIESTVFCLLVAPYPNVNPIYVPFESAEFTDKKPESWAYKWTDAERDQMVEWSQDFPRDEKGRFTSL